MPNLTERQRQHVIDLLKHGKALPPGYKRLLFPPERQEYELVYAGKEREEDILAETMAVPLQPVKTFAANGGHGWHNILIFGDNLQAMKTLLQMKHEARLVNADGSRGVKLVYIDPPFSTKQEFRGTHHEKAYQDKIAGARFIEALRKRLIFLRELLADDGSIYVHLDWRKGPYIKCILDEVFGEGRFTNEIIWRATDPHNNVTKKYGNIHQTLYFYKMRDTLLNLDDAREPLSEAALKEYSLVELQDGTITNYEPGHKGRRFKLNDATLPVAKPDRQFEWRGATPSPNRSWPRDLEGMEQGLQDGTYYLRDPSRGAARCKVDYLDENAGQLPQDIWDSCGSMKGGKSYPTEKPEELLERIIRVSSNPDDIVLDAFAGSGTTLAVAEKLGRRWIGIDCGKLAMYTIQKRMLNLRELIGDKGKLLEPTPFTLCNAGLYDFSRLKRLPWKDWRFFALHLFECRDEPHTIAGVELDGYRRGDDVLVFNHLLGGGAVLDYGFIDDLDNQIGARLGPRFFIIAPAASVVFLEDYIHRGGTRYYILRIPYSIINELHARPFESITQPVDEGEVNELVDAVGFDFVRLPDVKCEYLVKPPEGQLIKEAVIQINTFVSKAMVKGATHKANRETLSMVMVDYDYPRQEPEQNEPPAFEPDQVFYARQLEKNDWEVRMPLESLGEQAMIVYIDIYGNEYKEIKTPEHFRHTSGHTAPEEITDA